MHCMSRGQLKKFSFCSCLTALHSIFYPHFLPEDHFTYSYLYFVLLLEFNCCPFSLLLSNVIIMNDVCCDVMLEVDRHDEV